MLSKHKENGDIEFAPVYFDSITKTVITSEYDLDKSFQEILYRIDNWINEKSGWVIESVFLFTIHYQCVHTLNGLIN